MFQFIKEFRQRVKFWKTEDKLGPDFPWNYWRLFFPSKMIAICKKKFKYFHDSAQFRPGAYARVCSKISIGKRVVIRPNTMLCASPPEFGDRGQIIIEDDVLIASGVQVHTDEHIFDDPDVPIIDQGYCTPKDIIIKKGAWIGANCVLLGGAVIGENSVIGAGSVILGEIPARSVAFGSPAKVVRKIIKGEFRENQPLIDPGVSWYSPYSYKNEK